MQHQANARYPGDVLEHLRAFDALAGAIDRGGKTPWGPAARALAVDASVLRRRLSTLAAWVGAPLVTGRGPATKLTRDGDRTRALAKRALDAIAELGPASTDATLLRVACTGTVLGDLMPPVLAALRAQQASLAFRIRRAGAEAALKLLADGEVDFAVVRASTKPGDATRLAADRLWLATNAGDALARTKRLTAERVAREPFVGYGPSSSTMRRVMDVMAPLGAAPFIEVDGKAPALRYVEAGLGVAFVSALAQAVPHAPGVVFREVTSWFAPVAFWLLPAHKPRAGIHARFVAELVRRAHG